MVPLFDVLVLGAKPSWRVFAATAMALLGVVVLGQDPTSSVLALHRTLVLNVGDWLSILAALLYTVHVVRLQVISLRTPSVLALVEAKSVVQAVLASAAVALSAQTTFNPNVAWASLVAASLTTKIAAVAYALWIGAFTTAVANAAQIEGQRRVGPSRAAIVYSSQPAFAVALAMCLLHDRFGPTELVGGSIVVMAGMSLTLPGKDSSS
jgi:drug/metabolite transporter (DMT)-like permease